jgi:hypothetical protein
MRGCCREQQPFGHWSLVTGHWTKVRTCGWQVLWKIVSQDGNRYRINCLIEKEKDFTKADLQSKCNKDFPLKRKMTHGLLL